MSPDSVPQIISTPMAFDLRTPPRSFAKIELIIIYIS